MSLFPSEDTTTAPFTAVPDGERHAIYAELNAKGPVHRVMMPIGQPAWVVTGHTEARALLSDPRLVKLGWQRATRVSDLPEHLARGLHMNMLTSDPPSHTRLRKLVASVFTRRRIEKLAPRIEAMTGGLLDALDGAEVVDLVTTLAYPLPIGIICDLLGIPEESRHAFRSWTQPLMSPGTHSVEDYVEAATAMHAFVCGLIDIKRDAPQDDLLSDLIAARDGDERLSEDELTSMVFLLVLAGHETMVNLLGNSVLALLTHPDQMALLRAEPNRIEGAIEELLRYDSPVQSTLSYHTAEPIEIGATMIPAGETVLVALMAANRDEAHFPHGDRLDITRRGTPHTAFGHGLHYCLGAPLARLEARIAIEALFDRFPGLKLDVPAESLTRIPSVIMNGLTALPVRLR
ncbi:cytochrome P450 [Nonomuraea sp. NPDC049709]|uniref:cytochrome P450 family protein n=1 Tax=Nonomuraea sp. NPDC049709 TaxID=3154736 RepID=UPI00342C24D6